MNVYLSDELAAAVKDAGIPISAVCQRALEDALRSSTALREGSKQPPLGLPKGLDLPGPITARLAQALQLSFEAAEADGTEVSTAHLLLGMIAEGSNLGLKVLVSLDIEPDDLRTELQAAIGAAPASKKPRLDASAKAAISGTGDEAVRLGHNYIGCEHLLLAAVAEPGGAGGRILRAMGVDVTVARRAVKTALTGFVHGQQKAAATGSKPFEDALSAIVERLDRIESQLRGQ